MSETRKTRTLKVDAITRVEGEGALFIELRDGHPERVELRIYEPPRFFEALLRGRAALEVPDITARICGICPVAYQMSSCHAIEAACGMRVDGALRELRRLLYAGEWIESHALHVFMLHAPDFLGYPDAISLAKDHGDLVRTALRVKKAGNAIVARLGGREVHPVNVRVGGFYRAPTRAELEGLLPEIAWSMDALEAQLPMIRTLPYPRLERDVELVALRHPDEYPFCEGRVVSSRGLDVAIEDLDAYVIEEQVPYSMALQAKLRGRGTYAVGPIARFNLNFEQLSERAKVAAKSLGIEPPMINPFKSLAVRVVEMIEALHEARRVIEAYRPPPKPFVETPRSAGTGRACTEAPRGLLYHRYTVDADGLVTDAKIVPPTSQNQRSMEEDLRAMAVELAELPLEEATHRAEQAIRNYDPCISCATHFLTLRIAHAQDA